MNTYPDSLRLQAGLLKEAGKRNAHIARLLGVSPSTVRRWLDPDEAERDRVRSRDSKRARKGTCADCGTQTSYNGHAASDTKVSERCGPCAAIANGINARGTGYQQQRLYYLLEENGQMRFTQIMRAMGLPHNQMSKMIHDETNAGRIVRVSRGLYRLP